MGKQDNWQQKKDAAEQASEASKAEAVEKEVEDIVKEAEFSASVKLPGLSAYMAVLNRLHDPYQNLWFEMGKSTVADETSWIKCQVEAGLLKPV